MKGSETYRRYLRDLKAFGDALHRFLEVMVQTEGMDYIGYPGVWVPRPGQQAEAGRRRAEVDLLTGRGAYAAQAAGVYVEWKPSGTFQTVPLNPVAEWATIIHDHPRFDVDTIFMCIRQGIGVLEMKAEEAEEYESQHVRRSAARLAQQTEEGLGRVGRWALGAVGALIVLVLGAGIVYWIGWT